MADISNVDTATIRDLYTRLESLPCKNTFTMTCIENQTDIIQLVS